MYHNFDNASVTVGVLVLFQMRDGNYDSEADCRIIIPIIAHNASETNPEHLR